MSTIALLQASVLLLASVPSPESACTGDGGSAAAESPRIRVELRVEPFLDLWFATRAEAANAASAPAATRAAAQLFDALDRELGGPLGWASLEGRLLDCRSAADARAAFADCPESVEGRGGKPVALRARALELVEALAAVEAHHRAETWPAHEKAILAARSALESGLLAKSDEVFARHAAALGFGGVELEIPCVLVARAPEPGAVTHRVAGGRAVCFVGVGAFEGSALAEAVLHEATHALDVAEDGDLFDLVRARLESAGIERGSRAWRDVPHTLMFAASASTVRRVLDPKHADLGTSSGYYDRVGPVAAAVRSAWIALDATPVVLESAADAVVAASRVVLK